MTAQSKKRSNRLRSKIATRTRTKAAVHGGRASKLAWISPAMREVEVENNLREIFEGMPFGIFRSTEEHLLLVNSTFAKIFGEESLEKMLAKAIAPAQLFANPEPWGEIVREAKDLKSYRAHCITCRRTDGSVFKASLRARALFDENGKFKFLEGFLEDITEDEEMQERLRLKEKQEAMGQLGRKMAHEFNNLFAANLMHLRLLEQSPELAEGTRETIGTIAAEALRAANLTTQLLLFSRSEKARFESIELGSFVADVVRTLQPRLGKSLEAKFHESAKGQWIRADPGMIEQVLTYWCMSVRDTAPDCSRLELGIETIEISAQSALLDPARSGRFICFTVSTVAGGADAVVSRVSFKPYSPANDEGGTRLDLAISNAFIEQHAGWMQCESSPRKRASFRAYLPALGLSRSPAERLAQRQKTSRSSKTVLLVKRDVDARRLVALHLRLLGCAVLEAGAKAEAIKIWNAHQDKIAVLFINPELPTTEIGDALIEELRHAKESLKVIITDDQSMDSTRFDHLRGPAVYYLPHPFPPPGLARILRDCLEDMTLQPA